MSDIFAGASFAEQQDYLHERGINELLIKKLGLEICGPTRLTELGFKYKNGLQRAILMPIFGLDGEAVGFGARCFYNKTIGKDSRAKFLHPPGSGKRPPSLYFSPLANWDYLEYGQRVFICESYLKANIVCMLGYHAIGISGCWGWSHEKELHWSFSDIDWQGQRLVPTLFFDSDVNYENPKLSGVLKHFQAKAEAVLGVKSAYLALPAFPEGKGLDDYYMHVGEAELRTLLESEDIPPITSELDAHLVQLNNEVCYIHEVGKFADIQRNVLMGRGQFEDAAYATRKTVHNDKTVSVAKIWTGWNKRNEVDTLKYKPDKDRVIKNENESYFNLWRGWGTVPSDPTECLLFTEWLDDAFPSELERNYFCDWWGYQLQYPGIKLNTALMLVGSSGVGKGWMAAIAERIFGADNTWKCNLSDLESRFNSGIGAAQLLVIEEADVAGGTKVYNSLKDLITNEHIRYERKGVDAIKVDNVVNIFLNSNHIGVLVLDEYDRRFAVLEIPKDVSFANDRTYWQPKWDWVKFGNGAAEIMRYLLDRPISDSFDPFGEAPWTQAKSDMIETTHAPIDTWVNDHIVRGEEIVVQGTVVDSKLMSAKEMVFGYYDGQKPWNDITRSDSMRMVKALNNARVAVANQGKKVKWDGLPTKFYWVGTPGMEADYQHQLSQRAYWTELVASLKGEVASDGAAGYQDKKY